MRAIVSTLIALGLLGGCASDQTQPSAPLSETAEPAAMGAPASGAPAVVDVEKSSLRLPKSVDFRLANGLRVFLVPDHETPLVSFEFRIAGGSVEDPASKEGTAALLAELLAKGAGGRDAKAFQEAIDFVGGAFGSGVDRRWTSVAAEFLTRDTDLALELVGDALMRPRLDAKEFEKAQGLAIDGIASAREEPNAIIGRYYGASLFAGHPFGRPTGGDEKSLARVTLDDVRAAHAKTMDPARTWLAVAGDFEPETMRKKLEARFGGWPSATSAPEPVARFAGCAESGVLLVDMPGSLQTYFRFGNMGIDWSHPDYAARTVANTMLGERFTSRLNQTLRIDTGLTYGARSQFDDASQGAFVVRSFTASEVSQRTLDLAFEVYEKFVKQGMTQEELDASRRYIQGQYATGTIETADQAASMILALEFDGLPRDIVDRYFERLDALTLDEVNRVIRDRFPCAALKWVVVGQADKLRDYLKKFGPVTECKLSDPGFGPAK